MTGIQIQIDASEAIAELAALVARLRRPRPMFAAIGEHMVRSTQQNFERETDPEGRPWEPLKPETIARKQASRRILKILQEQGDLRGSIVYDATEQGVRIGSTENSMKPIVMQLGTDRAGRNRSVRIPARPYLGIGRADRSAILEIANQYLDGQ